MATCRAGGFQWDQGNWPKCGKHGVGRSDIERLFASGNPAVYPDLKHSDDEGRFFAIGRVQTGRWIFVVFTLRGSGGTALIRPISARFMHDKEVDHYERQKEP